MGRCFAIVQYYFVLVRETDCAGLSAGGCANYCARCTRCTHYTHVERHRQACSMHGSSTALHSLRQSTQKTSRGFVRCGESTRTFCESSCCVPKNAKKKAGSIEQPLFLSAEPSLPLTPTSRGLAHFPYLPCSLYLLYILTLHIQFPRCGAKLFR